jgi:pSer/pThr/pTyr-binding forkhead associated (FHA) protein
MTGVVFGQSPDCDVQITDDPFVSSRHARAWQDEAGTWIEDLGSMNGTYVQHLGSPPIRIYGPTRIQLGDTVWLGTRTSLPWTPGAAAGTA